MMKRYLYIIIALTLCACTSDELDLGGLTAEQQSLIGKAVNFNATKVDEFGQRTRTTWIENGEFNEDDLMRIYREYQLSNGTWEAASYRTYLHNYKYATGTSVSLGTDWRVGVGRTGYNSISDSQHGVGTFTQQKKDSITWEDGRTVRFRSWSRSNYAACLTNCYKYQNSGITNYYPDYCVSDWVTVSGPTSQIALTMRHVCSRIVFAYRNNGSHFYKVELATDWNDYKRRDNADTNANDKSETDKTDEQAQTECNQVLAAYNRMCMPAGVDIDKGELYAMTKAFWDPLDNIAADNDKLRKLEDIDPTTFYHYGTQNGTYVKDNVQRPIFANVNTSCYLLTIPYDMSNDATGGEIITLPPCTRFRVYMRDVNRGDGMKDDGFEYEGTYHIFSLQDMTDDSGAPLFPNGLAMLPGYSYKFYVGYRYRQLTITANDNFSWEAQDREEDNLVADIQSVPEPTTANYTWWKDAIKEAIPTHTGGDFNPVFHIKDQQEFIEFINLVNGTAATLTSGLTRQKRNVKNPDHEGNSYDEYNWWYTEVSDNKRDTTWVTSAEATALGYLLYQSYHPANANQPAYSEEEYVREAYPFYDETRDRHYTVYLDCDLDLFDWSLPSIGKETSTPFMGYFDGQMHTLSNVNMQGEYLFKYIKSAAIRNLKVESTHKVSLVKEGTNTNYIVGIDLRAHSTTNSIAERLTSNNYNNPSYIVGCIHVGDAGGALVGASSNLYMLGCMQAAEGIPNGQGALLGAYLPYSSESNWQFFTPQISLDYNDMNDKVNGKPSSLGRFSCNYYDTELSKGTNAVFTIPDKYSPLEYIRGRDSYILKAKNDNLMTGDASFNSLKNVNQRLAYYGLAPWRAMNYAINQYNSGSIGSQHRCNAHYENNSTGYVHRYPDLLPGVPTAEQYANTLEQNN